METLRTAISAINKLRPRFVVVTGSFTHAYPSSAPSSPSSPSSSSSTATTSVTPTPASTSTSSAATTQPSTSTSTSAIETQRDFQLNQFMRTMARVSETIPLLFVPGDRDVGECLQLLRALFCFKCIRLIVKASYSDLISYDQSDRNESRFNCKAFTVY